MSRPQRTSGSQFVTYLRTKFSTTIKKCKLTVLVECELWIVTDCYHTRYSRTQDLQQRIFSYSPSNFQSCNLPPSLDYLSFLKNPTFLVSICMRLVVILNTRNMDCDMTKTILFGRTELFKSFSVTIPQEFESCKMRNFQLHSHHHLWGA